MPTEINSEGNEAFSENHHSVDNPVEEGIVYSEDPRDNLPGSLEYLYLDVYTKTEDKWKDMIKMFETANANTPKLTLDNTCIDRFRSRSAKYGRAVEPSIRFANPLFDDIWRGHSYFL
jgi:hypothetical protein